jgi:hypothetical protein
VDKEQWRKRTNESERQKESEDRAKRRRETEEDGGEAGGTERAGRRGCGVSGRAVVFERGCWERVDER